MHTLIVCIDFGGTMFRYFVETICKYRNAIHVSWCSIDKFMYCNFFSLSWTSVGYVSFVECPAFWLNSHGLGILLIFESHSFLDKIKIRISNVSCAPFGRRRELTRIKRDFSEKDSIVSLSCYFLPAESQLERKNSIFLNLKITTIIKS